uniref:F-box associated beta-propeller type 3 domain-containing protein n=2 Tax=Aegilops tauschii TaxID=37682 RepID=A0A453T2E8_AEGTS
MPSSPAQRCMPSLSRGWHAVVSSPAFLAAHKSRVEPHLLLATSSSGKEASNEGRDLRLFDEEGSVVRVIKSVGALWTVCHGLDGPVCVTRDFRGRRDVFDVNVINPATGSVLIMATVELENQEFFLFNIGCAAPSGVYKVVHFDYKSWKVLTLGDDAKWRQTRSPAAKLSNYYYQNFMVTVNGVMHFLYTSRRLPLYENLILRLDLESEEWKASLEGPTRLGDRFQKRVTTEGIVRLNDTLCLVQLEEHFVTNNTCTNLWLLTNFDKGTWVKAYTVSMTPTTVLYRPLRVMRDGGKLLFYGYHRPTKTRMLQVYDPLTATSTHFMKFPRDFHSDVCLCDLNLEWFV